MKTKIITLIGITALVTLSFSFVNSASETKNTPKSEIKVDASAQPVGGLAIDEK